MALRSRLLPTLLLLCLASASWALGPYALLDRTHPLTRGLLGWWRAVPGLTGSLNLYDLLGVDNGILANMGSGLGSTSGWSPTAREGGYMQLNFDGTDGP